MILYQNYDTNLTCVHYPFDNLLSLAIYNPMINNINSDINNPNISLTKNPKNIQKDEIEEDDLDLFINSLTKDINNKTQKDYFHFDFPTFYLFLLIQEFFFSQYILFAIIHQIF